MKFFGRKHGLRVLEGPPLELTDPEGSLLICDISTTPLPWNLFLETRNGKQRFNNCTTWDGTDYRWDGKVIQNNWKGIFDEDSTGAQISYNTITKEWLCGYCGADLTGDAEAIVRKLTVFRRPPPGARDLRIQRIQGFIFSLSGRLECHRCGSQWVRK